MAGLTVASYENPAAYYEGGRYELNLTFDTLRDKQWQRLLEILWQPPTLSGPLATRYYPGQPTPPSVEVQPIPPTTTVTFRAQLQVEGMVVGCDIEATRSLFECVSVVVPVAMFREVRAIPTMRQQYPELQALDQIFYDLALRVYDVIPFKIAAIGYERTCQLPMELQTDPHVRHEFLTTGNFLAQDEVLMLIEPDISPYQQVRPDLRWMAPLS
ncbi:MAG: hypothetical protein ABI947_19735 [Chloroflexota bacterium]